MQQTPWPGSGQPGCIWNETSEEEGDGDSKLVYCWLLGIRSLINHKYRSQRTNSSGKPQVAALE